MRQIDALVLDALWDGEWKAPATIAARIGSRRRSISPFWHAVGTLLGPRYAEPKIERVLHALQRLRRKERVLLQHVHGKGDEILSAMIVPKDGEVAHEEDVSFGDYIAALWG